MAEEKPTKSGISATTRRTILMAKKKSSIIKNPLFIGLLAIVLILLYQANGQFELASTINPDFGTTIISYDSLANQVLAPGSTASVSVTLKNNGNETETFNIEHRLLATKNYPQYMAAINPADNAVAGEEDSVVTKQVSGLQPGETIVVNFEAPVPTRQSTITTDAVDNVDDSYVQIIGLYHNPGDGYLDSAVSTNVLVNDAQAGSTVTAQCEKMTDCEGWLAGDVKCLEGVCTDVPGGSLVELPSFEWKDFYQHNQLLIWLGGALLLVLLVLFMVPEVNYQ